MVHGAHDPEDAWPLVVFDAEVNVLQNSAGNLELCAQVPLEDVVHLEPVLQYVAVSEGSDGHVVVQCDVVRAVDDETPLVDVVDHVLGDQGSLYVPTQVEVYRLSGVRENDRVRDFL